MINNYDRLHRAKLSVIQTCLNRHIPLGRFGYKDCAFILCEELSFHSYIAKKRKYS